MKRRKCKYSGEFVRQPFIPLKKLFPSPTKSTKSLSYLQKNESYQRDKTSRSSGPNGSRRLNIFTFKRNIDAVSGGEGVARKAARLNVLVRHADETECYGESCNYV